MSKTLIISDLHFCKPSSSSQNCEMFRPLWEDHSTIVLNGDTAETLSRLHAKPSIALTEQLIHLAKEDGVQTRLLSGNHDPDISHEDYLFFCEEQILVMHGHSVFDGVAPWSWRSPYIKAYKDDLLKKETPSLHTYLEAVRNASAQVRSEKFEQHRPSRLGMLSLTIPAIATILKSWIQFPSLTHSFIEAYAPQCKIVITGHTHRRGVWQCGNRTIINTGCFGKFGFPSRPYAVSIDTQSNTITVYNIMKLKHRLTLGKVKQVLQLTV